MLPSLRLRSIDNMHLSRDFECHPPPASTIAAVVAAEVAAHADTVTVDMPYDSPEAYGTCRPKDPLVYESQWIEAIRAKGLHVWFRQQWLGWEGNQGAQKLTPTSTPERSLGTAAQVLDGTDRSSYLALTYAWILSHRDLFRDADIFTPESEPEQAGITACKSACMFADHETADRWLQDSMTVDRVAFSRIGRLVTVGYWGVNCGATWLSEQTVRAMGVLVTDCYQRSPQDLLARLRMLYGLYHLPIVLGEWGDIWDHGDARAMVNEMDRIFSALSHEPELVGVNYWQAYGELSSGEGIVDRSSLQLNAAGQRLAFWFS